MDLNVLEDNHQPLVSVLMTAYNRQEYIAESIESVLGSTYTDFELIVAPFFIQDLVISSKEKINAAPEAYPLIGSLELPTANTEPSKFKSRLWISTPPGPVPCPSNWILSPFLTHVLVTSSY